MDSLDRFEKISELLSHTQLRINLLEEKLDSLHTREFLTRREAVEEYSISKTMLDVLRREQKLNSYKLGRKVFIRRSELESLIESNELD